MNILTMQYHKDVAEKNDIRVKEQQKQYIYYAGDAFNIKKYLVDAMTLSYAEEDIAEMQLQWINITEKIINQMAVVYLQPAVRTIMLNGEASEDLTDYYNEIMPMNINTQDKDAHRLAKLHNVSLPFVSYNEEKGRFDYKTQPSYLYNIKHEYGKLTELSYEKYFKEQGEDAWYQVYWTDDEHYRRDAYGNKREMPDGDGENPFGVIPTPVFRLRNTVDFWGEGRSDVVNVNEQTNLLLTKLINSDIIMGTEGTTLAINLDLIKKGEEEAGEKKVKTGRRHPIAIDNVRADEVQPSLQHITTDPHIGETQDTIDWYIKMIANFNGLNPSTILSQIKDTSDYQKLMDAVDQMEVRKDDIEPCRAFEGDRFEITKAINNAYVGTDKGKGLQELPEDATLSVDFAEVQVHKTLADRQADWEWKLERNIISLMDVVKEINPDLDNEQAEELLEANRIANSKLSGKAGRLELLTKTPLGEEEQEEENE